jgi:hypothetical protein
MSDTNETIEDITLRPQGATVGEGEELRIFLKDFLQIPANAYRFSLTLQEGQPVLVSVEYLLKDPRP